MIRIISVILSLFMAFMAFAANAQTVGPVPGSSSGGVPSGPAGGDLSGTYPNPSVTGAGGSPFGTGVATALNNTAGGAGGFALQSGLANYCALAGGAACTFTGVPITTAGSATTPGLAVGIAGTGLYSVSTTGFCFANVNGVCQADYGITLANSISFQKIIVALGAGGVSISGAQPLQFQSGTSQLFSPSAAKYQFGAADAAVAASQSILFQNVVAGTSNTAGANATIQASLSTGSGLGGDLTISTAGTGAAATVQNSAVVAARFKGATQQLQLTNSLQIASISACATPSGANGNFCVIRGSSGAGFCTFEVVTTTNTQIIAANVPGGC